VAKAVEESKSGKVEYRTDRTAIVHLVIGKTSFDERQLLENYAAVIDEIVRAKPAAAKGRYILSSTLTTTMGPGIRVDTGKTGERDIVAGAAAAAGDDQNGGDQEPAAEQSVDAEEQSADEEPAADAEEPAEASPAA
jgi:hypothetical protein